jgi:hypothetical protein
MLLYGIFLTEEFLQANTREIEALKKLMLDNGVKGVKVVHLLFPPIVSREFVFNYVFEKDEFCDHFMDGGIVLDEVIRNNERTVNVKIIEGWKGNLYTLSDEIRGLFK